MADELGINAVLDNLKEIDDKPASKSDKTSDAKPEPELELEPESEEELNEEDQDQEDQDEDSESKPKELEIEDDPDRTLDEYVEYPTRQAVLKKYPDIFKEFPGLDKAFFREKEYTRVFPTVQDAKTARQSIDNYSRLESDLSSGDIKSVLNAVKRSDPNAFARIGSTYLAQLSEIDKDAYFENVSSVLRTAINSTYTAGKEQGGEDGEQLMIAAQLVNKFIYGSTKLEAHRPRVQPNNNDQNPREQEFNNRQRAFYEQQLNVTVNEISSRLDSQIRAAVAKQIDPKDIMPEYVKTKAIGDVMDELEKLNRADERFTRYKDDLWRNAIRSNYTDDSKAKIRAAVINKAKSVLPEVIKKVRANAMKGLTQSGTLRKTRVKDEDDSDFEPEKSEKSEKKQAPSSNNQKSSRRANSVKDVMAFLNS